MCAIPTAQPPQPALRRVPRLRPGAVPSSPIAKPATRRMDRQAGSSPLCTCAVVYTLPKGQIYGYMDTEHAARYRADDGGDLPGGLCAVGARAAPVAAAARTCRRAGAT